MNDQRIPNQTAPSQPPPDKGAEGSHADSGATIARFAAIVSVFKLSNFVMGIVVKSLFSAFAKKAITDAYFWAWENFNFVFLVGEDLLGSCFLPVFVHAKNRDGEKSAWQFAGTVLAIQGMFALFFVSLGIIFSGYWVGTVGEDLREPLLARRLLITFLAGLAFMTLASTLSLNLNAYKKFTLAAFSEFVNKLMIVAFFMVGALFILPMVGLTRQDEAFGRWAMFGAAAGFSFGAMLKFLLNIWGLRGQLKEHFKLVLKFDTPEMKSLGLLLLVLFIGSIGGKVRDLIELMFKQRIEGVISYVSYAKSLKEVAVIVFPFTLGVVLFPYLSEAVARQDKHRLVALTMNSMRMMFFVFIPIILAYVFFRTEIAGTLFFNAERFGLKDISATGMIVSIYAIGFFAYITEIITLQVFFSFKDVVTPTVVSLLCAVLDVAVVWATFDAYTYMSIPIAYVVSRVVKAIALMLLLMPQFRGALGNEGRRWLTFAWKIIVVGAVGAAACFAVQHLLPEITLGNASRMICLKHTAMGLMATALAVFAAAYAVRLAEFHETVNVFGRVARKVTSKFSRKG
ncbi:MAG: lipid II flippase MurJ [Candidatus Brocadiia bacterium]